MPDGPNYEKVFTDMKVFNGKNPEDVKHIVRFLHFFNGTDAFELYAKHYLPMLSPEIAAQFAKEEEKPSVEQKIVEPVEEKTAEKPINVTVVTEVPKKKGRPKSSKVS